MFVGIGRAADVDRYLDGVEHDVVTDLDHRDPDYSRRAGGAPAAPPGAETFWVASATGSGEQTLDWEPEDGDWRVVVMNADGRARASRPSMSIGAELDSVLWIGIGLLGAGALLRRRRRDRGHGRGTSSSLSLNRSRETGCLVS